MKIVSWNINGLNNILSKTKAGSKENTSIPDNTLATLITEYDPDIICLQEVRCSHAASLLDKHFKTIYPYIYLNCAEKAGYSGTAIMSKYKPIDVQYNFHTDIRTLNNEGRIIRMSFDKWVLINIYSPNSKTKLERLEERIEVWEPALRDLIQYHSKKKSVVLCGDLNVAHEDIDIHSPYTNRNHAGFTDRERLSMSLLLHNTNMVDSFRYMKPSTVKYSWWSNFHQSRSKNKGWRIDYFLVSKQLVKNVIDSDIFTEYHGSDHAPTSLELSDF